MTYPMTELMGFCMYCGERMVYDHDTGQYLLRPHPECAHRLDRDEDTEEDDEGIEL